MVKNGPNGKAVYASEKDIARMRLKMGMVFQNFNLFPHKSVLENLMMAPMLVNGIDSSTARDTAMMYLEKVGMAQNGSNYPYQLSGECSSGWQ